MVSPNLCGQIVDVTAGIPKPGGRSVWDYQATETGETVPFDGGTDRRMTCSLLPRANGSEDVVVVGICRRHDYLSLVMPSPPTVGPNI